MIFLLLKQVLITCQFDIFLKISILKHFVVWAMHDMAEWDEW